MSPEPETGGASRSASRGPAWPAVDPDRALATLGVAVLLGAALRVLHRGAALGGTEAAFLAVVAAALLAGTAFARLSARRVAVGLAVVAFCAGGSLYLLSLPPGVAPSSLVYTSLGTVVAFLTGRSVLEVVNVGVWVLVVTPAPVFLTWYLAVCRRFVAAVAVAGAALGVLVLTGDAGLLTATVGAVGGVAAVGFGELAGARGTTEGATVDRGRRTVLIELAGVAVAGQALRLVPDGDARPVVFGEATGGRTLEATLTEAGDRLEVSGAVSLSPKARFTVAAAERRRWRVAAYDRYTGEGWTRTGNRRPYEEPLETPQAPARSLRQRVRAESTLEVMPAAWRPRTVEGAAAAVEVTSAGDLAPESALPAGSTYTVESRVPSATAVVLREADPEYPPELLSRYTQVPDGVPDRVAERAAAVAGDTDGPYGTAEAVRDWLAANREYSLSVERPAGDVADAFLFEMAEGYCTYYATAMAVMLRTQGVPARFVVGYTAGERVPDGWVVRGYHAHAWVEVYVPGAGWVEFDPTPGGPRRAAQRERLELAREREAGGADVEATPPAPPEPTPTGDAATDTDADTPAAGADAAPANVGVNAGGQGLDGADAREDETPTPDTPAAATPAGTTGWPAPECVGLGLVVLAGAAAGARATGVPDRAYRALRLRVQPRVDPETDVRRAYERLELLLARRARERRAGETVRQYLDRVGDDRARRVGRLYERARYGEAVDEAAADEAVRLVDELVGE